MNLVFRISALVCLVCATPWTARAVYGGLRYGRLPNYIPLWQPLGVGLFTFLAVVTS